VLNSFGEQQTTTLKTAYAQLDARIAARCEARFPVR
jgi:hypothetical protein